jgi:hypothetical protein
MPTRVIHCTLIFSASFSSLLTVVDGDALKKVNNSGHQPILVILGNVIICIEVCQAIPALVDG